MATLTGSLTVASNQERLPVTSFRNVRLQQTLTQFLPIHPLRIIQGLSQVTASGTELTSSFAPSSVKPVAETSAEIKRQLVQYQALLGCSDSEWSSILQHAQHLFTPSMKFDDLASILNNLHDIEESKRASCVKQVKLLVDNVLDWEIGSLLKVFDIMPESEHASFVKYAKFLLSKRGYSDEIIKTLSHIPEVDRESSVKHTKSLITAAMDGIDIYSILRVVASIPASDRESVVKHTKLFVTDSVGVFGGKQILNIFLRIPASEHESVAKHAALLLTDSATETDRREILSLFSNMPASDRESVVRHAKALFKNSMSNSDRSWIANGLAEIPEADRESVTMHAQPLLTDTMTGEGHACILKELCKIPQHDREHAVQHARRFLIDSMTAEEIACILIGFSSIPTSEREQLAAQAKLLISDSMNGAQRAFIVLQLCRLPNDQRENLVQQIIPLFEKLSDNMRIRFIFQISDLDQQERDDFVKAFFASVVDPDFLQACVSNQEAQVPMPHPKEPTLDEILAAKSKIPQLPSGLDPQHQEILTKALKIKQYYNQRGYICFLHGQEPSRLILQSLFKEVAKIRNPEEHFKDPFVYFRSEQFYQQAKGHKEQISDDLKKAIYHDNDQRDQVMSVDAYFLSMAPHESANYFCGETRSVAPLKSRGESDLDPLIANIQRGAKLEVQKEIDDLMAIVSRKMPCGNLCVICIPKDKMMNYSYPAVPGGKFCACRSEEDTLQQLIDANNDIEPKCISGKTTQWRLAAAALRPENGVRSFTLSPKGDFAPMVEEYIKPLAAKIAYLQVKLPKSHL